jgi:subtilase family serine protease
MDAPDISRLALARSCMLPLFPRPALGPGPGSGRAARRAARAALPAAAVTGLLAFAAAAPGAPAAAFAPARPALAHPASARPASAPAPATPVPALARPVPGGQQFSAPESTTDCQANLQISCYTPVQYRVAYDLGPLYRQGITGRGRTIVIVESFGSPTIGHDIKVFDAAFGFPDPDLQVMKFGAVPAFSPASPVMAQWAQETTLDVEYAHAIAPGAKIVLAETPVAETEGVTGFPQMMAAEKSLIDRGVGDVISQSFDATESTFPGAAQGNFASLENLRFAFTDAQARHVTVLAASGDDGATGAEPDGATLYPAPVTSWPSTDPLVTSVGGTQLFLDDAGQRTQPDAVWNDGFGAGGGGKSAVFAAPSWQAALQGISGTQRGTPDISMSAADNGAAWIYASFRGPQWELAGGTSEATPMFAGIVALADQAAGRRLGLINPALYTLGAAAERGEPGTGIVDVRSGTNSFGGVPGYAATTGYDLASGWGTIDAAQLVPALAHAG